MNHKRHLKKYKERARDGLPFPLKGSSNTYGRLILQNRERSGDTGKDSIIFDGAWGGGRGGGSKLLLHEPTLPPPPFLICGYTNTNLPAEC